MTYRQTLIFIYKDWRRISAATLTKQWSVVLKLRHFLSWVLAKKYATKVTHWNGSVSGEQNTRVTRIISTVWAIDRLTALLFVAGSISAQSFMCLASVWLFAYVILNVTIDEKLLLRSRFIFKRKYNSSFIFCYNCSFSFTKQYG